MKKLFLLTFLIIFSCDSYQNSKKHINPTQTIETITLLGDTLRSPEIKKGKSFDQFKSAQITYFDNQNDADIIYGTPAYMSPEVLNEPDKINYICKNCNFQCEHNKSEDSSIFSIDYNIDNIKKNSFINPFIYEDITLPRAEGIKCPVCWKISKENCTRHFN